jgi:hypothetical protein
MLSCHDRSASKKNWNGKKITSDAFVALGEAFLFDAIWGVGLW